MCAPGRLLHLDPSGAHSPPACPCRGQGWLKRSISRWNTPGVLWVHIPHPLKMLCPHAGLWLEASSQEAPFLHPEENRILALSY